MTEETILRSLLTQLLEDFEYLGKRIKLNVEDDEKLPRFTNARQKTAKSIVDCIILLKNPKLEFSDSMRKKALTDLMRAVLETEKKTEAVADASQEKRTLMRFKSQ